MEHSKEDPIFVFPERNLRVLAPNFHFHVSVIDLCIPTIGPLFCSKLGGPIMGIYKSLKETWISKLGTRPCSFISGNICFEFLVPCLCSDHFLGTLEFTRRPLISLAPMERLSLLGVPACPKFQESIGTPCFPYRSPWHPWPHCAAGKPPSVAISCKGFDNNTISFTLFPLPGGNISYLMEVWEQGKQ